MKHVVRIVGVFDVPLLVALFNVWGPHNGAVLMVDSPGGHHGINLVSSPIEHLVVLGVIIIQLPSRSILLCKREMSVLKSIYGFLVDDKLWVSFVMDGAIGSIHPPDLVIIIFDLVLNREYSFAISSGKSCKYKVISSTILCNI